MNGRTKVYLVFGPIVAFILYFINKKRMNEAFEKAGFKTNYIWWYYSPIFLLHSVVWPYALCVVSGTEMYSYLKEKENASTSSNE
jgi:hypothetical protein